MTMPSPWRKAFDLIERPVGSGAESWVQTDTFMDLAATGIKLQRRLLGELRGASARWLALWGLASRADAVELMNQVGSLEREVRDLRRQLEQSETSTQRRHDESRKAA
jgi:hypothetical protein